MTFNISEIRSQLQYGGARPSQFQVLITNPVTAIADLKTPFMVKAATIPPSEVGEIAVPYFGRLIYQPGDRTFQPWNTSVMNDEDFAVRDAIEAWSNAINGLETNIASLGSAPSNYKSQAIVTQYGKDGSELRIYQLEGVWPVSVGEIQLDWEAQNQIEYFNVTWRYDSYRVVGGKTGNGGGV